MTTQLKQYAFLLFLIAKISLFVFYNHSIFAINTFENANVYPGTYSSPSSTTKIIDTAHSSPNFITNTIATGVYIWSFLSGESSETRRTKRHKNQLINKHLHWGEQRYREHFGNNIDRALSAHYFYRFESFKTYIKQSPDYHAYIESLNAQVNKGKDFDVEGCDKKEFKQIINSMAQESTRLLTTLPDSRISPLGSTLNNISSPSKTEPQFKPQKIASEHVVELQAILNQYITGQRNQLTPERYIIKRVEALHNHIECIDSYKEETYEISANGKKLLSEHSITVNNYELFYGNQLQRFLHQEFVDIINGAGNYYSNEAHNQNDFGHIANTITRFAHTGQLHNHKGDIPSGFVFADFCHGLLKLADSFVEVECDIGCAIGRGFMKGGDQFAQKVIHPISTIQNTLLGLGKLLITIEKITFEATKKFVIQNKQDMLDIYSGKVTQWDIIKRDALTTYRSISGAYTSIKQQYENLDYQTMLLDIENATAFATDSALTAGLLVSMSMFTKGASSGLSNYLINNPPFIELPFNAHTFEAAIAYKASCIDGLSVEIANTLDGITRVSPGLTLFSNIDDGDGISSFGNKPRNAPLIDDLQSKYKIPIEGIDEIAANVKILDKHAQDHILAQKHNWDLLVVDHTDWDSVARIITKVMKEGAEGLYIKDTNKKKLDPNIRMRTLNIGNHRVQVNFRVENDVIRIGNAWIKNESRIN